MKRAAVGILMTATLAVGGSASGAGAATLEPCASSVQLDTLRVTIEPLQKAYRAGDLAVVKVHVERETRLPIRPKVATATSLPAPGVTVNFWGSLAATRGGYEYHDVAGPTDANGDYLVAWRLGSKTGSAEAFVQASNHLIGEGHCVSVEEYGEAEGQLFTVE